MARNPNAFPPLWILRRGVKTRTPGRSTNWPRVRCWPSRGISSPKNGATKAVWNTTVSWWSPSSSIRPSRRRKLLKSRPNQRKKARNNPCLITTKAAFGSLLFYSLRCCCTICTFILYLFSFTAFRNALAGLNAGILWAGILIVVFFEMFRAVFSALRLMIKLPNPRKNTSFPATIDSLHFPWMILSQSSPPFSLFRSAVRSERQFPLLSYCSWFLWIRCKINKYLPVTTIRSYLSSRKLLLLNPPNTPLKSLPTTKNTSNKIIISPIGLVFI